MTSVAAPAARTHTRPAGRLRTWLTVDAVVTGANALVYVAAAQAVVALVGSSATTVRGVGAFLLLFTVLVGAAAVRGDRTGRTVLAWSVVVGNVVWALFSLVVVLTGSLSLTGLGSVWVVGQALVIATLAALQLRCLR